MLKRFGGLALCLSLSVVHANPEEGSTDNGSTDKGSTDKGNAKKTLPEKPNSKEAEDGNAIGDLVTFFQEGLPTCGRDSALVIFEQENANGEHKGDSDIAAQCVSLADGHVLWNSERATLVSASVYLESNVSIIQDGHGGAIAVFQAEMRTGEHAGDTEIFAQRLGKSGRLEWRNGERSVVVASSNWREQNPIIVASDPGSFIVIYELSTTTGKHAGDIDISANRIDVEGKVLWQSTNSTGVSNGAGLERSPAAVSDGHGGALVFFEAEARTGEMAGNGAILGQRINSAGERQWNQGDHPSVAAMTNWAERRPFVLSDGQGGAFVLFEREGLQGEHRGDIDVASQHMSPDGVGQWGDNQGLSLGGSAHLESNIRAISDAQGGFIAVFEVVAQDGESAGVADLYGQRVSPTGQKLWNAGKPVLLASSKWSDRGHQLLPDGKGGLFLVFEQHAPVGKHAGDVDLAGVRINANGEHIWGQPDRPLDLSNSALKEHNPQLIATGDGGLAVVFEAEARTGEFAGDSEIYILRFGPDGTKAWEKPKPLASSHLLERAPVAMSP
jgi:hypothetical protein